MAVKFFPVLVVISVLCPGVSFAASGVSGTVQGDIFVWNAPCNLDLSKYRYWEKAGTRPETEFAAAFSEDRKSLFIAAKCYDPAAAEKPGRAEDFLEVRLRTGQNSVFRIQVTPAGVISGSCSAEKPEESGFLWLRSRVKSYPDHWETEIVLDVARIRQKPDWFSAWQLELSRKVSPEKCARRLVIPRKDASGREVNSYYCVLRALPGASAPEEYVIRKRRRPVALTDGWESAAWKDIPALSLRYEHWKHGLSSGFVPEVSAKIQYDPERIFILYKVEDCFIRGDFKKDQQLVCLDSAVEIFLQPHGSRFYYNLESNCIGTILLRRNCFENGKQLHTPMPPELLKRIRRHSSLPGNLAGEISTPTVWYLALQVPREVFSSAAKFLPLAGQVWRGNVFKCADRTSHPHWLAWHKCGTYHEPEAFGTFRFEE